MHVVAKLVENSRNWVGLLLQVFLLAGAAVSCYFVGLFLYIGLDLMVLLDKQSLLESIFFYAAIFSVVMAISTIVTAPIPRAPRIEDVDTSLPSPRKEEQRSEGWGSYLLGFIPGYRSATKAIETVGELKLSAEELAAKWRKDAGDKLTAMYPTFVVALMLFIGWFLYFWRGVLFVIVTLGLLILGRTFSRFFYPASLLAFVFLGWLRADLLATTRPSLTLLGNEQREERVNVILASSRGVLAMARDARGELRPRYIHWDRITAVEPARQVSRDASDHPICNWFRLPEWSAIPKTTGIFGFCA